MTADAKDFPHDIDLHAYVDGELTEQDCRQIEQRLTADAKARAVVAALLVQRAALAQRFALPEECLVTRRMIEDVKAGRAPSDG